MRFRLLLLLALLVSPLVFRAQPGTGNKGSQLIQLSGVVVDDSLRAIPFTGVYIRNAKRGTYADISGYFSFVALPKDTIEFKALGYNVQRFVMPDTLSNNKYSLIQVLVKDTLTLPVTTIYPWPTKEQFKEAFLRLNVPDDDLTRAQRNLAQAEMVQRFQTVALDGSGTYKAAMAAQQSKLYYAGQMPPNNLLNPIAWAKFVDAWRSGAFKRQ